MPVEPVMIAFIFICKPFNDRIERRRPAGHAFA
jgi:hypothetical protein